MKSDSLRPTRRELLHAKLDALLDECDLVADNAAFGQTSMTWKNAFSAKDESSSKKPFKNASNKQKASRKLNNVPIIKKTVTEHKKPKDIVSAHGQITILRRYRQCTHCKKFTFPADVTLGLSVRYTKGLSRYAARCCGLGSYRLAADNLRELCGIHLSHTVKNEGRLNYAERLLEGRSIGSGLIEGA